MFLCSQWKTRCLNFQSLRSTCVSQFYRGLFIILLFPELSLPITKKYFQIKLSCVVQDDEKLTHNRSRAVFIQEPRKFLPIGSNDHQTDSKASVVFVRTSLRSVRTATTSGQYSPVRPSRSVSKRLLFFCQVAFV